MTLQQQLNNDLRLKIEERKLKKKIAINKAIKRVSKDKKK